MDLDNSEGGSEGADGRRDRVNREKGKSSWELERIPQGRKATNKESLKERSHLVKKRIKEKKVRKKTNSADSYK